MINKALRYTFFGVILLLSSAPFLYNRTLATTGTLKQLLAPSYENITAQYTRNDRYSLVQTLVKKHPTAQLYFLTNSTNPNEKSSSWQMIQTRYQAYPRLITSLSFGQNDAEINQLAHSDTPMIVVSPFKQQSFENIGTSIHPDPEYYLYIIPKE